MNVTTSSKRFTLNVNDIIKGLIMAVGGALLQIVIDTVNDESLTFDWKKMGITAAKVAAIYLLKNFFDKPKVVVTDVTDKTIQAVKDGTADVAITHQ